MLFALLRIAWRVFQDGGRPWRAELPFATYLFLIGLQAAIVYAVGRCGAISIFTMRYVLLTLLGASGLIACYLKLETSRTLKALVLVVLSLWTVVSLGGHALLVDEYLRRTPPNSRRALADYLVSNDIGFGYATFWDAYSVVFLAQEKVLLASTDVSRIQEYKRLIDARRDHAVTISRVPCPGGTQVAEVYFVCPP